jgi:hypothetical protein
MIVYCKFLYCLGKNRLSNGLLITSFLPFPAVSSVVAERYGQTIGKPDGLGPPCPSLTLHVHT